MKGDGTPRRRPLPMPSFALAPEVSKAGRCPRSTAKPVLLYRDAVAGQAARVRRPQREPQALAGCRSWYQ